MKAVASVCFLLALVAVSGATFADCPDKLVVCNDGSGVRIGTCWNWGKASCTPCDGNYRQRCDGHGGMQCLSQDLAGVLNVGEIVSGFMNGKGNICQ